MTRIVPVPISDPVLPKAAQDVIARAMEGLVRAMAAPSRDAPPGGFYGERDLKKGQLIHVVLRGTITAPNAMDSCMQVMTSSGMYHYIFDGDPAAVILKHSQSWPPKPEDVWLFGSKLWHVDNRGMLSYASRVGGFTSARSAESVLHSAGNPPELLFRWSV